ncbi:MAG: PH domain-containing protein [Anaerolineales bacterium]|nr:PH domain-containing protein [Anaerolineales bacterium]
MQPSTRTLRPVRQLLYSYLIHSLFWGPALFYPLITNLFRYRTLTYEFDEDGLTASWGHLSRREVTVNYRNIQDIHLRSDIVERWLGLARIEVQTASGEAAAELIIEGVLEYEALRDHLIRQMRRARQTTPLAPEQEQAWEPAGAGLTPAAAAELTQTLQAVTAELQAIRTLLASREENAPLRAEQAPGGNDE